MADLGEIGVSGCTSLVVALDTASSWDIGSNPITCYSGYGAGGAVNKREDWRQISGVITDQNDSPCARKVLVIQRGGSSGGRLLGAGESDATTGVYTVSIDYTGEVMRIVLDSDTAPLLNDLIDRVLLA